MRIKTEIEFHAAHKLRDYEGKCKYLHGHTYRVIIWVEGDKLDKAGILWDFGGAKVIKDKYCHKYLNDEMEANTTAENICTEILTLLKADRPDLKFKVRVYETPRSYAEDESK